MKQYKIIEFPIETEKLIDFNILDFQGYVYIAQFEKNVKIGMTTDVLNRMKFLDNMGKRFKNNMIRVAISEPHTNYRINEKKLHDIFSKYREEGEFFNINIEEALQELDKINLEHKEKELTDMSKDSQKKFNNVLKNIIENKYSGADGICLEEVVNTILKEYRSNIADKLIDYLEQYSDSIGLIPTLKLTMIVNDILEDYELNKIIEEIVPN